MKKVLSFILAALAGIAAVSCVQEKPAVFDDSLATAPVILSSNVSEDGVSVTFTPGYFGQSFNSEMPVNHSLVIVSLNGESVTKILTSSVSENVISVSAKTLSRALITLGCNEGDRVNLELSLRASMQDQARDNGLNGYVESVGRVTVNGFEVTVPQGSPYEGFDEVSTWSVIGSLSEYGISWDGDLQMWTDGNTHVAAHVKLAADDEFKFRKDQDWGVNMGGDFGGLDTEFDVTQDGPNIKVGAAGVFDIFYDASSNKAWISEAFDPYPEYTQSSNWSVIGALSKYGISWNGDIAMVSDGTNHVALGVALGADDEFKFRQDADWAVNLGGDFGGLDTEFAVTQDGPNIAVGAEGVYDLFVNPGAGTATVTAASGAKVSGIISTPEEPTPVEITGWNIIGLNGDWDNDILATEDGNVWTAVITATEDTKFKWRKDGAWDENYGMSQDEGYAYTLGVAFPAVAGGADIPIAAGMYKVVLDLDALTITVSEASFELPDIDLSQYEELEDDMSGAGTWGIIGPAVSDWSTDVDLQKIQDDPEIWGAMNVPFQADKFKFRGNDEWGDYDLGGGEFAIETPIMLSKGGSDITAERGVYTVFLYPTYGLAYLVQGSGEVPVSDKPAAWSLIGTIGGTGWDTDFDLTNTSGDVWKISNFEMNEGEEFKIRADHEWNKSYGGPEANAQSTIDESNPYDVYEPVIGETFSAGSLNIRVPATGSYDVTFDYANETILIEEYKEYPDQLYMIGEEFGGWDWSSDGVVEMVPVINNQWGGDATGQFYTIRYISAGKGFKFCSQRAWSGDFWGLETNDGFTEDGGNCTVSEDGVYMVHVDLKNSKVHVEPARVYGTGDCFGGWGDEKEENLMTADGKTLKITIPTAANFRAFVGSDIATSSWWTREFNVIDGKLVYRTGDELASVPVLKGQVVTIDFNALTGTITGDGEEEEQEPYSLIGWHAADSWSTNVPLVDVEGQPDWRVAQNIGANSGNIDFKFRRGDKWVPQIGAEDKNPKKVNVKFKVSEKTDASQADPANIHLDGNGLYDVYLNEKDLICFILDAGTEFAVPTEWESGETPELDWYIIGDAVGGWSNENDVPFESFDDSWYAAKNVSILGEKNFKFRANHAWTYQLTCPGMRTIGIIFNLEDGNGSDNDMQIPSDGVYDVYLSKELTSAVILTAGSAFGGGGEEPKGITIDGDFSDWDGISGVSDGNYEMFKVASDADNIYFFSWRNTGGRYSEIWNGEGYVYFGFDLDNNSETGVTLWGNGPLEFVGVIWPYGDHAIIEAPESAYGPDGKTIPGVVCKGVVDDSGVKIEFSVPRSSLPEIPTTSVLAWSRGNKDLNTVTYNVTL